MLRVAVIDAGDFVKDYFEHRGRLSGVMVSHAVDSLEGLLSARAAVVDGAVVHSPMQSYRDAVDSAARYGKHVLLYGQIGLAAEEIVECVEMCAKAGVCLYVARPLRAAPYQQAAYRSLRNGDLGELGLVRIHSWKQPNPKEASPLCLIVNEIDVACWLFDAWPDSIYALPIKGRANNLQIHLGFPCGGMAIIDCNDAPKAVAADYFSLTMVGSKGATYADDHRNVNLIVGSDSISAAAPPLGTDFVWQSLNEFAANVAANVTDSGFDCLRSVTVAKSVYMSIKMNDALRREGAEYVC